MTSWQPTRIHQNTKPGTSSHTATLKYQMKFVLITWTKTSLPFSNQTENSVEYKHISGTVCSLLGIKTGVI